MANVSTPLQNVKDAVRTILRLNVGVSSDSRRVSLRTTEVTYHFSQNIAPDTRITLFSFMRNNTDPDIYPDKHILHFLAYEANAQFQKQKKLHMLRVQWGILFFVAAYFIWTFLELKAPGVFFENTPVERISSLVLWFGGILLFWFNRIYFPDIKAALNNNCLRIHHCQTVYQQLPKKKLIQKILYGVTVVMLIVAVLLIR